MEMRRCMIVLKHFDNNAVKYADSWHAALRLQVNYKANISQFSIKFLLIIKLKLVLIEQLLCGFRFCNFCWDGYFLIKNQIS